MAVAAAVAVAATSGTGSTPSFGARPGASTTAPALRAGSEPERRPDGGPTAGSAAPGPSGLPVPTDAEVGTHPARLDDLSGRRGPAPVHLRVADLGVDAPVTAVGVANDGSGELDVPADADAVAWYQAGPSPGRSGSAVLAGHVDYNGAEGVFFRLGELGPGAEVTVGYDDGSEARFTVVDRKQYTKADLPTGDVFAADGPPRLTLVTCGGSFDSSARSYRDNIVVQAVPA